MTFRYDPPAGIDDLAGKPTRAAFLDDWDGWITEQVRHEIKSLTSRPGDGVAQPLFFCEKDHSSTGAAAVHWNAFPLTIKNKYPKEKLQDAYDEADELNDNGKHKSRKQDEYCEWHWYDKGKPDSRIVFSAEGPEYWIKLAEHDFDAVLELYQRWVSPGVREEHLRLKKQLDFTEDPDVEIPMILPAGSYNPYNMWNTELGIMHLTQSANTLAAEINLAARATVLRRDAKKQRITNARRLIASSGYGSINRSSDPRIGEGVNKTVLPVGATEPVSVTLANPVGLYMDGLLSDTVLTDESGEPLVDWFRFVRGDSGNGLMAVLAPPPGDKRTLDNVYVASAPLRSAGQVAQQIQMAIYAATANLGTPMPEMRDPLWHACVADDADLGNLDATNLNARAPIGQSCATYADEKNLGKMKEAYRELFQAADTDPAPADSRRASRNA